MLEEQNPLRCQTEKELLTSEWFQKFTAWGQLLNTLKAEVPLTQLCQLQWVTGIDALLIHCPNPKVRAALKQMSDKIDRLNGPAQQIILKHSDYEDLVVSPKTTPPIAL